ncbi:basic proline-rich protein-like [Poecile atricapillus]|uniref:basic proline-rich protein-like n=1 Tax=Poecile atricapillus TaxID=48891 RepID=UPI002739661B|nr:basic proline-rich protein-like [Poecile atricapillus]
MPQPQEATGEGPLQLQARAMPGNPRRGGLEAVQHSPPPAPGRTEAPVQAQPAKPWHRPAQLPGSRHGNPAAWDRQNLARRRHHSQNPPPCPTNPARGGQRSESPLTAFLQGRKVQEAVPAAPPLERRARPPARSLALARPPPRGRARPSRSRDTGQTPRHPPGPARPPVQAAPHRSVPGGHVEAATPPLGFHRRGAGRGGVTLPGSAAPRTACRQGSNPAPGLHRRGAGRGGVTPTGPAAAPFNPPGAPAIPGEPTSGPDLRTPPHLRQIPSSRSTRGS